MPADVFAEEQYTAGIAQGGAVNAAGGPVNPGTVLELFYQIKNLRDLNYCP